MGSKIQLGKKQQAEGFPGKLETAARPSSSGSVHQHPECRAALETVLPEGAGFGRDFPGSEQTFHRDLDLRRRRRSTRMKGKVHRAGGK